MSHLRHRFCPALENLENRTVPYALSGYKWAATNVTASFLPDGTSSEGYSSSLNSMLDQVASRAVWQQEFARALQNWANVSNLNFHFVADDGSATGASGSSQGDSRFGDIRLGAHALDGYLGYAWYPSSGSTLGGDITLATAYTFHIGSNIDLYSTLLHESGHALGLGHSTSGTVMYGTITGVYSGLSADDIAGIQALYGARRHDVYDTAALNDSLAAATSLTLSSSGGFSGSADLTSLGDVDYYRVVAPTNADGTLTVTVDARNLSFLNGKVSVYDASGALRGTMSASNYGGAATLSLSGLTAGATYYVAADGASGDEFGMGAYKLSVQFGVSATPTPTPTGLAPDAYEVNDTLASARSLGKKSSFSLTGLTVHNGSDLDYFSFTARSSGTFNVSALFSHASGDLDLAVLDDSGNVLASSASLDNDESVTLSLVSGRRYHIKVWSAAGEDNDYSLTLTQLTGASRGGKRGGGLVAGHGSYAAGDEPADHDHEDDGWCILEAVPSGVLDELPVGQRKRR